MGSQTSPACMNQSHIEEDNGTENGNEDTNNDQTLNGSKLSDEMYLSPAKKKDVKHEKQDGNDSDITFWPQGLKPSGIAART